MIEQKISKIPEKLKSKRVVLEILDQSVAATIDFGDEEIIVENKKPEGDYAYIATDFETLTKLASGEIGLFTTLKLIITGKLKVKNMGVVKEFQKILS